MLQFNRNKITLKQMSFCQVLSRHVSFLVIFALLYFLGGGELSGRQSRHRPFKHVVKLRKLYVTNLFNII